MKKKTFYKLIIAIILLIVTFVTLFMDYVAIYPTTMVGFLLVLILIGIEDMDKTVSVKAAQYSVIIFSGIVMALNFFITIFLPMISSATDLSGISVEMTTSLGTTDNAVIADHFVEVTMNDMHELCYTTTLLLTIYIIFLVVYRVGAYHRSRRAKA
jgi:signal transduction histidine kinase